MCHVDMRHVEMCHADMREAHICDARIRNGDMGNLTLSGCHRGFGSGPSQSKLKNTESQRKTFWDAC